MDVQFLDLKAQNNSVKDEILPLWQEILETAWFIGGKHVKGLEEEFAAACNTSHCVTVSSGTDALRLVFQALDLKQDDEVIAPVNTFIATTEAITQAGAKVVFVDPLTDTYNIDPDKVEAAITPNTKGIVPVHLYGQMADLDHILAIAEKHGLWVVEDSAQAHLAEYKGRRAGCSGLAGAFSFYPGKNMGACGEAGAVCTNDKELAETVAKLRDHGSAKKYYHDLEGYNARCDALQAAALRVKLKKLPEWNEARRNVAAKYMEQLADVDGIVLPTVRDDCLPVWHLFVIQVENRDAVQQALKDKGVATALHYPIPLHLQKAYSYMGIPEGTYPVTEAYTKKLLSLPMFPELTDEEITYVCDTLKEVISA